MSNENMDGDHVPGERERPLRGRILSTQSRVSNAIVIALMIVLGLGSLLWYYSKTMGRQGRAKDQARTLSGDHSASKATLPSLGKIDAFQVQDRPDPLLPPGISARNSSQEPRTLIEIPIDPNAIQPSGSGPPKSAEQLAQERELSGVVFSLPDDPAAPAAERVAAVRAVNDPLARDPNVHDEAALGGLLHPSVIPAAHARTLPASGLLLPKGAFIDCTLETAIDSSLPGMTTCVTAADTFGADGRVVLLDRGTKLIGETKGQVQAGASRLFVLWTEARTPVGVIVPLESPGADELGRSGLPGEVNRHFWQRFGAAMLVSVIEGTVQAAAQSSRGGGATVVVNPSASQDVLTEILKNTISIPPTVTKRNGDRIQVLVARDVDFRSVYELRFHESER
jgi:type IV secretion system protein VirB10